ncbi:MAG: cell division protein SepF [Eubacteriales bacterium]|nr:cell division protein SepF [Eubacteriales bacterium]
MGKFLDRLLGGFDDYDDEYYEDNRDHRGPSREEVARSIQGARSPRRHEDGRVVNFRPQGVNNEVIIIEPRDIATAQQVCDYVRSGKTVICNIEQIDTKIAQRVIDFLTGATYALSGSVDPISSLIFIVAPRSTHVSNAEELNRQTIEEAERFAMEQEYRSLPREQMRRPQVSAR